MQKIDSLNQVAEFHRTFKAPILETPQIPAADRCKLRVSLIAEELKYSKRFNSVVTLYKTDATELITMYETKAMESLSNVLQNMKLPDNYCFNCNSRVKLTLNLP